MNYYWEIVQFDGTLTEIPPNAVEVVKRRWDNNQPIHTTTQTIPANQIKSFHQTTKPFGQNLLETAAQAFKEPIYTEDGAIQAKWVKKTVPQKVFQKLYYATPAYKTLQSESGQVTVAFLVAVHDIDTSKVQYCSEEEIRQLTTKK